MVQVKKNKAYKFRLVPTAEQASMFAKTFGCVRFVYNKMLAERKDTYKTYKNDKETLKKIKEPTPAKYKPDFPFLKEVDSLTLANAQMNLKKAYQAFFKGNAKFPKFKSKKHKQTFTTNVVNGNIFLENGHIKLPKIKTMIKLRQHRQIPKDHTIKSVTVSKTATGKFYISILTEYITETPEVSLENVLGLDFSMTNLFVTSEGEKANYPRFYRASLEKLKKEQRKLSRRKKGSSRWDKQRLKVSKLQEKIANQRRDYLHKKSRELANTFDCIVIEDLNMQSMSKALNFGKSVADNGWGMFTTFLAYKLEDQGKQLIKIDKWFPSSKKCSKCGEVKENLPLSERLFECGCGNIMDRDHNAAINIQEEGKRLLQNIVAA
ncbi:transposase [Bacillus mexicanus]|uniref:RNA-guided endonuclease InsQ/TnpB family protein n=1 Tax=Bacillus mexicanus TaxID=2834415 RepID=UPI003D221C02